MFEDLDRFEDQLLALFSGSFLIGLGLGDSHLVTLFLYSLAVFFSVINAFYVFAFYCFCTLVLLVLFCI